MLSFEYHRFGEHCAYFQLNIREVIRAPRRYKHTCVRSVDVLRIVTILIYVYSIRRSSRHSTPTYMSTMRVHAEVIINASGNYSPLTICRLRLNLNMTCRKVSRTLCTIRYNGYSRRGIHRDHCKSRSEERRVGKECRSRWCPDHE